MIGRRCVKIATSTPQVSFLRLALNEQRKARPLISLYGWLST